MMVRALADGNMASAWCVAARRTPRVAAVIVAARNALRAFLPPTNKTALLLYIIAHVTRAASIMIFPLWRDMARNGRANNGALYRCRTWQQHDISGARRWRRGMARGWRARGVACAGMVLISPPRNALLRLVMRRQHAGGKEGREEEEGGRKKGGRKEGRRSTTCCLLPFYPPTTFSTVLTGPWRMKPGLAAHMPDSHAVMPHTCPCLAWPFLEQFFQQLASPHPPSLHTALNQKNSLSMAAAWRRQASLPCLLSKTAPNVCHWRWWTLHAWHGSSGRTGRGRISLARTHAHTRASSKQHCLASCLSQPLKRRAPCAFYFLAIVQTSLLYFGFSPLPPFSFFLGV